MQTLINHNNNCFTNICNDSAVHDCAAKASDVCDKEMLIKNICNEIKTKALEHGLIGQNFERCGWYTLACEEYGKRDGLHQAVKIIEETMKGNYDEAIL